MNEQDKQLLLQDLCARLPYGVICEVTFDVDNIFTETLEGINMKYINQITTCGSSCNIECVKPYLRPMSSMTEEERAEFYKVGGLMSHKVDTDTYVLTAFSPNGYDWLNAHHFDYRGLIPKSLAIEVTEEK